MKENPADPRTVLNNDCLAPEGYGEIIGGSQREDDYDKLLARIVEQGLDPEAYRWYLDLRKYGTFVHCGFGLGVERTVAWICGIPHIREVDRVPAADSPALPVGRSVASVPSRFHLVPQPVQPLQPRRVQVDAALGGKALHCPEPVAELPVGAIQRNARCHARLASQIHDGEEQVPDLVDQFVTRGGRWPMLEVRPR